jgi:hypothetical protein
LGQRRAGVAGMAPTGWNLVSIQGIICVKPKVMHDTHTYTHTLTTLNLHEAGQHMNLHPLGPNM